MLFKKATTIKKFKNLTKKIRACNILEETRVGLGVSTPLKVLLCHWLVCGLSYLIL